MPIKRDDTVRVHFRGALEDGTQFDASEGGEPLQFKVGARQVISGFEEAVVGLEPGDKTTVTIQPAEAYGDRDEQMIQKLPRANLTEEPELGSLLKLVSPQGAELLAQIVDIGDDEITLDFNQPLAGQTLVFDIEVVEVVPPF
jgi:FKBP-type peptidyl-prolyl cis-trans isomerase 2